MRGVVGGVELDQGHLRIDLSAPMALGPPGSHLVVTTAVDHQSYQFATHVLGHHDTTVVCAAPQLCLATERRAEPRLGLGLDSDLQLVMGEARYPVTDLSPRGLAWFVADADAHEPPWAINDVLAASFEDERGESVALRVVVRDLRNLGTGWQIGALHVPGVAHHRGAPRLAESRATHLVPARSEATYPSERVSFGGHDERRIVGLVTQTRWHEGPMTVIVLPPAWARTKESTLRYAQLLVATFDRYERPLAVLRFDYGNTLGESHQDGEDLPGREAQYLTFSGCVGDIRGAIAFVRRRFGKDARVVPLGMSVSGPLCLRAASNDGHCAALVGVMGASDIQDLTRMATGGIDYVSNYRAGLRSSVQNALGLLSDVDRWCADGEQHHLLHLQDAQLDAAAIRVPTLWVHGEHDAFVNIERLRSVLSLIDHDQKHLVTVPCGHTPLRGPDAVATLAPVVRFLLEQVGVSDAMVALPEESDLDALEAQELARAPRPSLPSPTSFWRRYMASDGASGHGFDVLTTTRDYRSLMRDQVALLELPGGAELHDLGAGPGHVLDWIHAAEPGLVRLYDLLPEVLERAQPGPMSGACPSRSNAGTWRVNRFLPSSHRRSTSS